MHSRLLLLFQQGVQVVPQHWVLVLARRCSSCHVLCMLMRRPPVMLPLRWLQQHGGLAEGRLTCSKGSSSASSWHLPDSSTRASISLKLA